MARFRHMREKTGASTGNHDDDPPLRLDPTIRSWAIRACLGVLILWAIYLVVAARNLMLKESGDLFGSLNALFSGLAFTGVIITIMMQSRELELQRRDLRQGIKAQKDQAAATARLHEQAEERTKQDHALRVLSAYQDWLSACRRAYQAVVKYRTCRDELDRRATGATVHHDGGRLQHEAEASLRLAEEAVIEVDRTAVAVDVFAPGRLPPVNWQDIAEGKKGVGAKEAFEKCANAVMEAKERLSKRLPTID